jgi:hypothetical protein
VSARDDANDKPRAVWRLVKSATDGRHHTFATTGEKMHALGGKPAAKVLGPW